SAIRRPPQDGQTSRPSRTRQDAALHAAEPGGARRGDSIGSTAVATSWQRRLTTAETFGFCWEIPEKFGGEAGIRTLGRTFRPYNGLANRRLQPLGHLTVLKLLRILRGSLGSTSHQGRTVPKTVP